MRDRVSFWGLVIVFAALGLLIGDQNRRISELQAECVSLRERLYQVEADGARHVLKTEGLRYYGSFEPTIDNAYRVLGVEPVKPKRGRVK